MEGVCCRPCGGEGSPLENLPESFESIVEPFVEILQSKIAQMTALLLLIMMVLAVVTRR